MNALTQTAKHSAAGQYLGYALQPVRLCFHLMTCPDGASVSLEHIDDVAIHLPDGRIILEQNKSALKQNPVSNWAEDLWKTIANWLKFVEAGEIDPDTTEYRIYVTPIKSGSFAKRLHQAQSDEQVSDFVALLIKELGKLEAPPACDVNIQHFLSAEAVIRSSLVKNLSIISTDIDPVDAIRNIFKPTVDPAILDIICERAIGAAKETADRLIRARKPAIIEANRFRAEQRAFVQKNNMPGLLSSLTSPPTGEEVQQVLLARPNFIRQLELIGVETDALVKAVSDYLRTAADIAIWAECGRIFEKNLVEWHDDLVSRHEHISAEIKDIYTGHSLDARGRIVYRRCALLQAPLDGQVVPGHFVHGSYNSLAHEFRLGWHPEYQTLMELVP